MRASKDTGVERPIRLDRTVHTSAPVKAMRAPRVPLRKEALTPELIRRLYRQRLKDLFPAERVTREIDEELQSHLEEARDHRISWFPTFA